MLKLADSSPRRFLKRQLLWITAFKLFASCSPYKIDTVWWSIFHDFFSCWFLIDFHFISMRWPDKMGRAVRRTVLLWIIYIFCFSSYSSEPMVLKLAGTVLDISPQNCLGEIFRFPVTWPTNWGQISKLDYWIKGVTGSLKMLALFRQL